LLSTSPSQRDSDYKTGSGVQSFFAKKNKELEKTESIDSMKKTATTARFNSIMTLKVLEDFIKMDLTSQLGKQNAEKNINFKRFYKFFIGTRLYGNYEGTHEQHYSGQVLPTLIS
jgi:hypothetical protein